MSPAPSQLTGAEGDKSPSTAGLLSVISTLAPIGLGFAIPSFAERAEGEVITVGMVMVGTGMVFGPSIGHIYAGEPGRGFGMAGLRVLAFGNMAGLGVLGAGAMFSSQESALGVALLGTAAVSGCVGVGLMIFDLVDAPSAARRTNREALTATDEQAALPTISIGPGSGALTWTF